MTRKEQERASDRRERILAAALELALSRGTAAVTHRAVAATAEVPASAIRYYFHAREDLLLACAAEIERRREAEAARQLATPEAPETALLAAFYGPDTSDRTLRGIAGFIMDCGRESERLGKRATEDRRAAAEQIETVLQTLNIAGLDFELLAAAIDGVIFTSIAEGRDAIANRVSATLSRLLRLAAAGS